MFWGMELSSSNIKKVLIFFQKKAILIFPEVEPCTFQPKLKKQKNPHEISFLYFRKQKPQIFFCVFSKESFYFV